MKLTSNQDIRTNKIISIRNMENIKVLEDMATNL